MKRKTVDKIAEPTIEKLEALTGIPRAMGKLESAASRGWGGDIEQIVTPSGTKLNFEEDEEAILRFVGTKDISDLIGEPEGSAVYNTFYDGKRLVSMPTSYSFKKVHFEENNWYYVWCASRIPNRNPSFNSMKDFEVRRLGKDNTNVICPENISKNGNLQLREEIIAELNYTRLNYPLRIS